MRTPIDETTKLRQELADAAAQVERHCSVIFNLLHNVGDYAMCSRCRKRIVWMPHRNGKRTAYDPNGVKHACMNARGGTEENGGIN